MTVAFFAPLKSPDHAVPSGDRTMARAVIAALVATGRAVSVASHLRIYDGTGSAQVQANLTTQAKTEAHRIVDQPQAKTWRSWVTYHNYYKAPDLIGPVVSKALGIPYIQIESTRARKRLDGPWAQFAAAAEQASDTARAILYVTERDAETLRRDAPPQQVLTHLRPFLPATALPPQSDGRGPMFSVGMMRAGDKMSSYSLIAATLAQLDPALDWRLNIAGDGPARAEVAALMSPFGDRVRLLGALDAAALSSVYGQARLLFWPGVNEAFGYAYLEAQAAGLPVVAQDRPGVRDVVFGPLSAVADGPDALAARLTQLMTSPAVCARAGADARDMVRARHLLPAAADVLDATLAGVAA